MKHFISLLLMFTLATAAAVAKDVKTVILTPTPQMHCNGCETKIKKNLRFERGVKDIQTDLEKQTVTIKYDAEKTTVEQLCKAFEKFGYTAREVKKGEQVKKDDSASQCEMK